MSARKTESNVIALFRDPMLARMLGFGFASGLPLPLTAFTLQQWFASAGLSVHSVSFAAMLGLPYTLKFLWSPLFDRAPPVWAGGIGRRRFWLLVVQPLLAAAGVALALSNPGQAPLVTAAAAFAVAFLSTCQDISVDAWRIETFVQAEQGAALAAYIWGYRGAMLVSSTGVIYAAGSVGWHTPLLVVAGLMAAATLLTLSAPPPRQAETFTPAGSPWLAFQQNFLGPLREFFGRPAASRVLAFVILFRLGKVMADNTAASFYKSLNFDTHLVGLANGWPLVIGLLGGAAFGGYLVARLGTMRALLAAGLMQAASLGLYLVLLATGAPWMLFVKIGVEYFAGSAADIAFLTYVSALCARSYTAAQYALLSSLAAIVFHSSGSFAGYLAEALGWGPYYALTILAGLPALAVMFLLRRRLPSSPG
jgi:PAT family beta-lactamase induction signal transducer AmpG